MLRKVISFDPSIKKTGVAFFEGPELVCWNLFTPKTDLKPHERIDSLIESVIKAIQYFGPDLCLVEMTTGKVNRGRHGGGGAGLSTYGMAVGAVYAACWSRCEVQGVDDNHWTRGVPKRTRQLAVEGSHKMYRDAIRRIPTFDAGADISDAIGLFEWWKTDCLLRETSM